jgi:DNA-binding transcriptional MerR regulator
MTPTRPNISPNGSYTVMQASRLLAIDRRTLRRYEAAGLVAVHLNEFGQRKYSGHSLLNLWKRTI